MRRVLLPILVSVFVYALPHPTHALDPIVQCGFNGTICTACDFFTLSANIMRWLVALVTLVITLVMVAGGVRIITSQGNPTQLGKAKSMMLNALIGFIILLAAWLIIDTAMKLSKFGTGSELGPWNAVATDACKVAQGTYVPPGGGTGPAPGSPTGPAPSGQCSEAPIGGCTTATLQATFGSVTNQAIGICRGESHGNPALPSGVDIGTDKKSVSWGLFQVNLTVHKLTCDGQTLDCPAAFSGAYTSKNHNVHVTNQALYDRCVAAAKNAECNIRAAKQIYDAARQSWNPWGYNQRACHYP